MTAIQKDKRISFIRRNSGTFGAAARPVVLHHHLVGVSFGFGLRIVIDAQGFGVYRAGIRCQIDRDRRLMEPNGTFGIRKVHVGLIRIGRPRNVCPERPISSLASK